MRIAQIAPLWESVPPQLYGGTERVVSYITEELIRQGHDVTLFASGNSQTMARLWPACPHSLRLETGLVKRDAALMLMQEHALGAEAEQFDIIHSHLDFLSFPLSRRCRTPVLTTLHGRLDLPELVPIYREYADMPVVSISNAQRLPLPHANWQGTVYHGLPDIYTVHPNSGSYLAYLGRICPEKRPDHAIEIAKRIGMPLRIAAKVDPLDREYFETQIAPLLDHPLVEYLGEINDAEKCDFLGNAAAVLCPYDWPEPFGIVLIEALACGTPVLAYRRGSIPEIIEDGVTGFICDNLEEMVTAIDRLPLIQREQCRDSFEARFTVKRMVHDYLALYERMAAAVEPMVHVSGLSSALLNQRRTPLQEHVIPYIPNIGNRVSALEIQPLTKEHVMNQEQFRQFWEQLKTPLKMKWEKITAEDLDQIQGDLATFSSVLQRRYGELHREEVATWANRRYSHWTGNYAGYKEDAKPVS